MKNLAGEKSTEVREVIVRIALSRQVGGNVFRLAPILAWLRTRGPIGKVSGHRALEWGVPSLCIAIDEWRILFLRTWGVIYNWVIRDILLIYFPRAR